jgi:hypothetical protein
MESGSAIGTRRAAGSVTESMSVTAIVYFFETTEDTEHTEEDKNKDD